MGLGNNVVPRECQIKSKLPFQPGGIHFTDATVETMQQLPRSEKLKLLGALWDDLSRSDRELESPVWHKQALAETEQRLTEGKEQVMDWEAAKKTLRGKF